jgi:hypothetical protein
VWYKLDDGTFHNFILQTKHGSIDDSQCGKLCNQSDSPRDWVTTLRAIQSSSTCPPPCDQSDTRERRPACNQSDTRECQPPIWRTKMETRISPTRTYPWYGNCVRFRKRRANARSGSRPLRIRGRSGCRGTSSWTWSRSSRVSARPRMRRGEIARKRRWRGPCRGGAPVQPESRHSAAHRFRAPLLRTTFHKWQSCWQCCTPACQPLPTLAPMRRKTGFKPFPFSNRYNVCAALRIGTSSSASCRGGALQVESS